MRPAHTTDPLIVLSEELVDDKIALAGQLFGAVVDVPVAESVFEGHNPNGYPQDSAAFYYERLLCGVAPMPPRSKVPNYRWTMLKKNRLDPSREFEDGYYRLFEIIPDCNIMVNCGAVSNNLFVVDYDDMSVFHDHEEEYGKRGIPLSVVQTPKRGVHVYLRSVGGAIRSTVFSGGDIKGEGSYVVGAGSRHPDVEGKYEWLYCRPPPAVDIRILNFISDNNGRPVQLQLVKTETVKTRQLRLRGTNNLSGFSRHVIATLDTWAKGENGGRTSAIYKACRDLHGNDIPKEQAYALLFDKAIKSGLEKYRARNAIEDAYCKPATPTRKAVSLRSYAFRAEVFASVHRWVGRTSSTDRKVFGALILRCAAGANSQGVFRASERELEEIAQLSRKTVRIALRRLMRKGLLARAGFDKQTGAFLFQFTDMVLECGEVTPLVSKKNSISSSGVSSLQKHDTDAMEYGALNIHGLMIFDALQSVEEGASVKQLMELTGLSRDQVTYYLRPGGILRKSGIVQHIRRGCWIAFSQVTDEVLDELIAKPAGKLGMRERRRRRNQRETMLYVGLRIRRRLHAWLWDHRREDVART